MNGIKVKLADGREVDATPVGWKCVNNSDALLELDLSDGAKLLVKPIVTGILRADEKPTTGDRLYTLQTVFTMILKAPAKDDLA